MWAYVGRSLAWLGASSALLLAGFLLLGGALVVPRMIQEGAQLSGLQLAMWRALVEHIVLQALFPHLLATLASWLLAVRLVPVLERSWRGVLAGLPIVAVLWFPPVGEYSFRMWNPTSVADYVNTLLLMSGGVTLALLLPRRAIRRLRPGCFAAQAGSGSSPAS
jgi:hypothetical protein